MVTSITRTDGRRFSLGALMLAAVAGAALALLVSSLASSAHPPSRETAGGRREGAPVPAGAESAARQAQLLQQNSELRTALLAALARAPECDSPAPAPTPTPTPTPEASDEEQPFEAPSREEIGLKEKAQVTSLEKDLSQEPVDPVWAPSTEQATARVIAAHSSLHLEDITCRETLCRVRITHRDLAKRDEDVELLLGTTPGGGQAQVYTAPGDRTTVMYFSRKGMLLSSLSPPAPLVPPPPMDSGEDEAPAPRAN
jgi:hypothetical protein